MVADLMFSVMLMILAVTSTIWHSSNAPKDQYVLLALLLALLLADVRPRRRYIDLWRYIRIPAVHSLIKFRLFILK